MRSRTSPMGHVLSLILPDRQPLLGSPRCSCNQNIQSQLGTYLGTYAPRYSCTHVLMYSCTYVLMYSCTHLLMYSFTHVLMYSCTHVLMYSCTHVLMYATCHHATASIATKTYRSTYCTYLVPKIIKKCQTHLQNILFIFIQITSRLL